MRHAIWLVLLGVVLLLPLSLRAGTWFAEFAPDTAAAMARRKGGDELSRKMEEGHSERR